MEVIKERKVAIIIGNSEYGENFESLKKSVYDTRYFLRLCKENEFDTSLFENKSS